MRIQAVIIIRPEELSLKCNESSSPQFTECFCPRYHAGGGEGIHNTQNTPRPWGLRHAHPSAGKTGSLRREDWTPTSSLTQGGPLGICTEGSSSSSPAWAQHQTPLSSSDSATYMQSVLGQATYPVYQ